MLFIRLKIFKNLNFFYQYKSDGQSLLSGQLTFIDSAHQLHTYAKYTLIKEKVTVFFVCLFFPLNKKLILP